MNFLICGLFVWCAATTQAEPPAPPSTPPPGTMQPVPPTDPTGPTQPTSDPAAQSTDPGAPTPAASPEKAEASGQPPTDTLQELDSIRPGVAIKKQLDDLAAKTNLRIAIAHTMLWQQATGGPGIRDAGGGDLDIFAKWTAIGAGTKDTGIVAFAGEYRYQIGDQPPSALGGQIGSLVPTTNSFSERDPCVKELYWDHRLFDDHFRYILGRIDPENFFGGHRLQSANTFFLNKNFSGNPTVPYPGSGMAIAGQIKPVEWFYLTLGLTDANGKATTGNFEGFFENGEYFTFAEAGFTPTIEGVGAGRYRLALWHIDARAAAGAARDSGVVISCDQDIGKDLTVFLRYGYADGAAGRIRHSVQSGLGLKGVFGEPHMFGFAAAWSEPAAAGLRAEKVLEVFQRFQLTEIAQFTVGVQGIFDPSNAPAADAIGVFSFRFRIAF